MKKLLLKHGADAAELKKIEKEVKRQVGRQGHALPACCYWMVSGLMQCQRKLHCLRLALSAQLSPPNDDVSFSSVRGRYSIQQPNADNHADHKSNRQTQVDEAVEESKASPIPPLHWAWKNVYVDPSNCALRDVSGEYKVPDFDPKYVH